jgi:hypothetical protein
MRYHLQSNDLFISWLSQGRADSCSLSVGCLDSKAWGVNEGRIEEKRPATWAPSELFDLNRLGFRAGLKVIVALSPCTATISSSLLGQVIDMAWNLILVVKLPKRLHTLVSGHEIVPDFLQPFLRKVLSFPLLSLSISSIDWMRLKTSSRRCFSMCEHAKKVKQGDSESRFALLCFL